jgi:hypothetical protein
MNTLPTLRSEYINPKTANIYANSIVRFLLYLYEQKNCPGAEIVQNPLTNQFDEFIDANAEFSESNRRKRMKDIIMADPRPGVQ